MLHFKRMFLEPSFCFFLDKDISMISVTPKAIVRMKESVDDADPVTDLQDRYIEKFVENIDKQHHGILIFFCAFHDGYFNIDQTNEFMESRKSIPENVQDITVPPLILTSFNKNSEQNTRKNSLPTDCQGLVLKNLILLCKILLSVTYMKTDADKQQQQKNRPRVLRFIDYNTDSSTTFFQDVTSVCNFLK